MKNLSIVEAAIAELQNDKYYPDTVGVIGKNGKLIFYTNDKNTLPKTQRNIRTDNL